jgi:hypothetical protein
LAQPLKVCLNFWEGKLFRKIADAATSILVLTAMAAGAYGTSVAIINGSSSTPEVGTTNLVTSNLVALETAVGNTTTVFDNAPANLAGFSAVWDIRWFDSAALSPTLDMEYTNFLAAGGALFVMGENLEFPSRDNSILSLIQGLGGSGPALSLYDTCANSGDSQIVNAPFTGPNPAPSITYNCSGGFVGSGTGKFVTEVNPLIGTGIAFAPGTLSAAPLGTLITMLDVNFMEGNVDPSSQNLLKNLIAYMDNLAPGPPPPGVPEPSSFVMIGAGLLGFGIVRTRLKR